MIKKIKIFLKDFSKITGYRVVGYWKKRENIYRYYGEYRRFGIWFDVEFLAIGERDMYDAWKKLYDWIKGHEHDTKCIYNYKTEEEIINYIENDTHFRRWSI